MNSTKFEWQQLESDLEPNADSAPQFIVARSHHSPRRSRINEVNFALVLFYSIVSFIIWQQTNQRIKALENDLVSLQSQKAEQVDQEQDERSTEFARLALEEAVLNKAIRPQWKLLVESLRLSLHPKRTYQSNGGPTSHQSFQPRRITKSSIDRAIAHDGLFVQEGSTDIHPELSTYRHIQNEVVNPLIEFILNEYGSPRIPTLVHAFTQHEDWETLAPAAFNLSAAEFESAWHEYLEETYPQTTTDSGN